MVYLLHFSRKYKGKQHYMGQTTDLKARLDRHKAGHGAKLVGAAAARGIRFYVVRKWQGRNGTRDHERTLKTRYKLAKLCPMCSGRDALKRG